MTTSTQPLVSVVIPCKNRAHYLRPTIDSILNQNYPNIECIVIDAASKDGTVDLLQSYGDRIQWLSEPDKGHSDAINKGWLRSQGEILAWLNADDLYANPTAVRSAVEYLVAHPEVDVVYGWSSPVDPEGREVGPAYARPWDLEYAIVYCDHCIPQPAAFMRRGILERAGWMDNEFPQKKDHELWIRIGLVGGNIHRIPEKLAHDRAQPDNLTFQGDTTAAACLQITQKVFDTPGLPPRLRQLEHRAMSNAYVRGIEYMAYAQDGKLYLKMGTEWAVRALLADPSNAGYVGEHYRRLLLSRYSRLDLKRRVRNKLQGLVGAVMRK